MWQCNFVSAKTSKLGPLVFPCTLQQVDLILPAKFMLQLLEQFLGGLKSTWEHERPMNGEYHRTPRIQIATLRPCARIYLGIIIVISQAPRESFGGNHMGSGGCRGDMAQATNRPS
jgi:hypothetical protein